MDRGVSEYGTSKAQASCTKCGTHSPRGEPFTDIAKWVIQSVFILPPLIRHPMYHLFLPVLFMSPNSQTGACTQPISLASTQGDQIIRFDIINREHVGIRTFYPSSFNHTWPGYASVQHLTCLGSCQVAHHQFLFLML